MNPTHIAARPAKATILAESLVASSIIKPEYNGIDYPIHVHKLFPPALFTMFYNILHPLVSNNYPLDPSLTPVDVIARSIAYDALVNARAVSYQKAIRESPDLVGTLGIYPQVMLYTFPIFVAALINSIGPVHFYGVPARGIHVPYLAFDEVFALMPPSYASSHLAMFNQKLYRSRVYALHDVNIGTPQSSPWWTFHAQPEHVHKNTQTYSLWSPVPWDGCDPALKLGALFAKGRLTISVGVGNFSSTPFYDVNDPPRANEFPPEVWSFPYFNQSQPAYYVFWERSPAYDETGSASHHSQAPSTGSHSSPTAAADPPRHATDDNTTALPGNRKLKLPDGSAAEGGDDVVRHRMIYYYFDHRVTSNISDRDLYGWSPQLNAL